MRIARPPVKLRPTLDLGSLGVREERVKGVPALLEREVHRHGQPDPQGAPHPPEITQTPLKSPNPEAKTTQHC